MLLTGIRDAKSLQMHQTILHCELFYQISTVPSVSTWDAKLRQDLSNLWENLNAPALGKGTWYLRLLFRNSHYLPPTRTP
jgi:hypothetical protein